MDKKSLPLPPPPPPPPGYGIKLEQNNPFKGKQGEIEEKITDLLREINNLFVTLEKTHPSHKKDFSDGLHKCQDIINHRIVQRDYPDYFSTIK